MMGIYRNLDLYHPCRPKNVGDDQLCGDNLIGSIHNWRFTCHEMHYENKWCEGYVLHYFVNQITIETST